MRMPHGASDFADLVAYTRISAEIGVHNFFLTRSYIDRSFLSLFTAFFSIFPHQSRIYE